MVAYRFDPTACNWKRVSLVKRHELRKKVPPCKFHPTPTKKNSMVPLSHLWRDWILLYFFSLCTRFANKLRCGFLHAVLMGEKGRDLHKTDSIFFVLFWDIFILLVVLLTLFTLNLTWKVEPGRKTVFFNNLQSWQSKKKSKKLKI